MTQAAPIPDRVDFSYDPAPERLKVEIGDRYGLFIDGRFVAPKSRKYFKSINPSNERTLSEIAEAGRADVDAAAAAAKKAQRKWARLKASDRAKYLFRLARRSQERARELAVLESMDGGKPIRESRDVDLPLVAQHFFYHAGWCDKLRYAFPASDPRPIGVCGQIIPWNFPLLMAAWKLAPRPRMRERMCPETGGDDPPHCASPRGNLSGDRPAARRGQHHHGRGRNRPAFLLNTRM